MTGNQLLDDHGIFFIIALVIRVFYTEPRKRVGEVYIYKYSSIDIIVIFSGLMVFLYLYFFIDRNGGVILREFEACTIAFLSWLSLYVYKYRIVIDGDDVSYGAIFKKSFKLSEVSRVFESGGRVSDLVVILSSGKKIRFAFYISDYRSLCSFFKEVELKTL